MSIKYALAVLAVPLTILAGCSHEEPPYRYPCQNMANWDTPQCQKPLCETNRECPDLIFKNFDEMKGTPNVQE